MDVKNDDKPDPTLEEEGHGTDKVHLRKMSTGMEDASKRMRKWYIDYVLSDVTFAAITTAILTMIKIYFKLNWESFWNGMILYYTIYIATMVSRIVKRFCDGGRKK